ncbi:excinuclease ABC subunit UvrB [Bacillus sp. TH22]|uniref:excinuclease ABC subunit UvrB n=1 Tax=Bacillus TaxID=1386 RepID=UPI0011ECD151|nr:MULTISPECIES: excinuclease ABC subunit UvrB [Bacillus]MBK5360428.1 excinuclease ABC subunit UvrB [Bacillus sp. TH44]MBK5345634.1 excinuclease ABC subunit UvrB [Bacillus sp. TH45]MBK5367323.1 excinuclease ABC subunit UvrB [Bacillus sp. TH50]MBK5452314.1 excinuclease ABC subunit UvrB [Bacillus sp. TH22]MBK5457770.1 excinuclease ABC subunit UvrB [Bacillus sp. TH23]
MRKSIDFQIQSSMEPMGDQPQAIEKLVTGVKNGKSRLLLKGATGTGKTFTIANVIHQLNRQTLIIAHNKTLVAQLWSELKELFPNNAVEYFVSYYDYYQPEAYVPHKDLFIEKDSKINSEIERMRHSVMASLLKRTDVIVVASISCLYPMSAPEDFNSTSFVLSVKPDGYFVYTYEQVIKHLIDNQYKRNDIEFEPGTFRIRGGSIDIYPMGKQEAIRLQFFGDELEEILTIHPVTEEIVDSLEEVHIFAATSFITTTKQIETALPLIEKDLVEQLKFLRGLGKFHEAERLEQRTLYDLELLKNTGHCMGIENYSLYMQNREKGSRCFNLTDYFEDGYLTVVDESHVTLPQFHAMYAGDQSRKKNLIDYGYRLPSSLDNRPPKFEEFMNNTKCMVSMSATPGKHEVDSKEVFVEQVIRPTGLIDPVIEVKSSENYFETLINEIKNTISRNEKVLVIALTKKQAEEITKEINNLQIKAEYLHSEVENIERSEIIRDFRMGNFDVLVGINLLREGLDLPEVSLVAVIGADQRGFLRSKSALLQLIGRAARNINGRALLFADSIKDNIEGAIEETERRREIQIQYNKDNNIVPKTIVKKEPVSLKNLLGIPEER